ncbi:hypothetical protein S58_35200 [Bradyrhizobium oligotrophicum S58]|uniref:Uncharacterized protein n=1 Tax=Bradyrhizobium oligotrophicum S58 TaxID=1245469 RepID=M4Z7H2_9BRAD|nr:hypothetical protein S58_35200 [Bradyrhizobium oligotrophicum S58]
MPVIVPAKNSQFFRIALLPERLFWWPADYIVRTRRRQDWLTNSHHISGFFKADIPADVPAQDLDTACPRPAQGSSETRQRPARGGRGYGRNGRSKPEIKIAIVPRPPRGCNFPVFHGPTVITTQRVVSAGANHGLAHAYAPRQSCANQGAIGSRAGRSSEWLAHGPFDG